LLWRSDGRLEIRGTGWSAVCIVDRDPWRVVSVAEMTNGGKGWRLELQDHEGSVPGQVGIKKPGQPWVELELVRIEVKTGRSLPEAPDLPLCGSAR
jgi:hypothetical protein